jgi:Phosphoesterase family
MRSQFRQRLAILFAALGVLLLIAVGYIAWHSGGEPTHHALYPIKHIIIIDKENRSFDEMFGRFPGADGATTVRTSSGQVVPLGLTPSRMLRDISHTGESAKLAVDGGKMDRFDLLPGAWQDGTNIALTQLRPHGVVTNLGWEARRIVHDRRLRQRCEARLRELDLPEPFDVRSFCDELGTQRGHPILLHPVTGTVGACGVWVSVPSADLICKILPIFLGGV